MMTASNLSSQKLNSNIKPNILVKRSRIHILGFVYFSVMMLLAVHYSALPAVMYAGVAYIIFDYFQKHFGSKRVTQIIQQQDGLWCLLLSGESHRNMTLTYQSVRRYWIILQFKKPSRTIVILPDSLDEAGFRRIRVWLRFFEKG